ncbi:hypothetical protein [Halorarius litoreus]|uniref:hypothetical protein n=1 Tax=Halorarius litoreus TaxID=2962676 RepID=UPI0020CE3DF1|nr:hypothetical protein [Halorarius litoreus]
MPSDSLLSRTVEHAARVWPLLFVPVIATLLDVGRIRSLLEPTRPNPANGDSVQVTVTETERVFSVTFGVPRPVSTLWSFVNAQPNGVSTGMAGFDSIPVFVAALVVSAVVSGVLAAGYLGSMEAALDGRFDFLAAVQRYARPLVGFSLLEAGVGVLLVATGAVAIPLIVVVAIALLVFAYLFFATPYLVVIEDIGLAPALRHSFELATNDGRIVGFFLGYVLISAVLSVPISALAFAAEPFGLAAAIVVSSPIALLLNVATLLFVRDVVGQGRSSTAQSSSNMPVDM